MPRMIDAEALYEAVSDHVTTVSVCPTADWARGKAAMKEICLEDIKNAPTVGGWISVKDRLPELTRQVESDDFLIDYSEYVVVLSEGRNHFPKIGRYAREGLRERWEDKDYDPIPDVTHWMLLPEKPKGDNNAAD